MESKKNKNLQYTLREQESRFQAYLDNTREAIWRIDLNPPLAMTASKDKKAQAIFHDTVISEANDSMARMYGYSEAHDILGRPLGDFMLETNENNIQGVSEFVDQNFLVKDAITHEQKFDGSVGIFLNNTSPKFRGGFLVSFWGSSLEITELYAMKEDLNKANKELHRNSKILEEKNTALKELVALISIEKENLKDQIMHNIEHVLLPALEKIQLNNGEPRYIDQFRSDLEQMTSAFGRTLISTGKKLTPREIEICRFVKNGLRNKEIAEILNISIRTVEKHRRMIRNKLGINNKRVNLQTHLSSMNYKG